MKKTLLLFAISLSAILTKAQTVGDAFTVNDINYEVTATDPTNEVQIVGNSVTTDALTIPATVDDSGNTFNVTFIKKEAFSRHETITSLTILGDTQIDQQVFNACPLLVSADLSNITSSIGLNSFVNCPSLETVDLRNAASIGKFAFKDCPKLSSINLSKLTDVGIQAFLNDVALTSIDLPAATVLGGLAFWKCTNLSVINIPVIDSIAPGAFNATGIKTLTLPSTLTSLPGANTFRNIPALEELIVEFETPFILDLDGDLTDANHMFSHQALYDTTPTLTVPFGTSAAFAAENGWNIFNIVEAEDTAAVNSVTNESFSAYPNPVVDVLSFSTNDIYSVDIYNTIGAKIASKNSVNGVDMSNLSQGVYYVKCYNKEGVAISTIKVVKN